MSSAPDHTSAVQRFLAEPRFAAALTLTAIGAGVFAEGLHRTIGWAGLIGVLGSLVVLSCLSIAARRRQPDWQGLLPVSLVVFVALAALSVIWSEYQWATVGGLAYLAAFTVLGVAIALTRDTIQIVRAYGDVFRAVLVVSLVIEIFSGLLIDTPIPFLGVEGRLDSLGPIQGVMGSRNQFGLVALLAMITFTTEFATRSIGRVTALGSLVLAGVCILLSRSPVALAALVAVAAAAGALLLLRKVSPDRRHFWQWGTLALTALVVVVSWLFRTNVIAFFGANSDIRYRLALWHRVVDFVAINPLEGWGWIGRWRSDLQPFLALAVPGDRDSVSALNAYLDVWLQLGLIGLGTFSVLVLLTFTRSWLLAGQRRSLVFAWPPLILVGLLLTSLAESSMLMEYGWLTFVICSVKAARELSWRRAFSAISVDETQ